MQHIDFIFLVVNQITATAVGVGLLLSTYWVKQDVVSSVEHILGKTGCSYLGTVSARFLSPMPLANVLGGKSAVEFRRGLLFLLEIEFDIIYDPSRVRQAHRE